MLDKYLQNEILSIVFIGDFNPIIFQPYWFAKKELIREKEAELANVEVIHSDVVRFDLEWVKIDVTKTRCEFKTNKEPYFDSLKDLTDSTFRILKETPVRSLGINHIYTLNLGNKENYYQFGNILSPLNNWSDSLKDPKLMQLEIIEEKRSDGMLGSYRVRITPSVGQDYNVTINLNDHYSIEPGGKGTDGEMLAVFNEKFEASRKRSKSLILDLLKKTL